MPPEHSYSAIQSEINNKPQWYNFHVYGDRYALTIHESLSPKGTPTVNIDAAEGKSGQEYDWDNKIRFMFTTSELLEVLYLLLGLRAKNELEFKFHGEAKNKSLQVKLQSDGFFISLSQASKASRGVKLPLAKHNQLTALILSQYAKSIRVSQVAALELIKMQSVLFFKN